MKLMILVPKVVQNYINQFPETTNNAYKYFNYDRRVVNERAETRFDTKMLYKGPEDLTDQDYDVIVSYARALIDPMLAKYSRQIACEEALDLAIRSYKRGIYDGKINASKYGVLLKALMEAESDSPCETVRVGARRRRRKEGDPTKSSIRRTLLKQLGLEVKDIPLRSRLRSQLRHKGLIVRAPGTGIVIDKPESK